MVKFDIVGYRDYFYPSNLAPLWTDCYDKAQAQQISKSVLNYLDQINVKDFLGTCICSCASSHLLRYHMSTSRFVSHPCQ